MGVVESRREWPLQPLPFLWLAWLFFLAGGESVRVCEHASMRVCVHVHEHMRMCMYVFRQPVGSLVSPLLTPGEPGKASESPGRQWGH